MQLSMTGFDHQPRTRIVFGCDSIDRLGELTRSVGGARALIVTDRGISSAGHVQRAIRSLAAAGLQWAVYDAVRENPTTRDVDECLAVARAEGVDVFIGLGGGSSMDTAKGCNFLLTNGGRMADYRGIGKATQPMLPLIAIPTTAGTGSECQSFALIAAEDTHMKMACGDPKAAPQVAILDPLLTLSQPRAVAACTGIDALSHALETAVTRSRNELSGLYSQEAFRLIAGALEAVLETPEDVDARARMLLGAAYAGLAIENSMLGAAHAAANPLTAHLELVHGHAVGVMLPHVIRFNAEEPRSREYYHRLAVAGGLSDTSNASDVSADRLAGRVEDLLAVAGLPTRMQISASTPLLKTLSAEAAGQWTARHNPREIGAADFEALYRAAGAA